MSANSFFTILLLIIIILLLIYKCFYLNIKLISLRIKPINNNIEYHKASLLLIKEIKNINKGTTIIPIIKLINIFIKTLSSLFLLAHITVL